MIDWSGRMETLRAIVSWNVVAGAWPTPRLRQTGGDATIEARQLVPAVSVTCSHRKIVEDGQD